MAYSGSCHCGAVTFTVDAEAPKGAMSCNCSHCQRKGFLLTFVPAGQFTLASGEDQLTTYTFNKHAIRHRFCQTCGVQAFGEGEREGTALRAFYVSERGDAFVDISPEVSTRHPGGSATELLTVYAIVNAVTAKFYAVTHARNVQIRMTQHDEG